MKLKHLKHLHREEKAMKYTDKNEALARYKAARAAYLADMTEANWITFCDARTECMRLGIRFTL